MKHKRFCSSNVRLCRLAGAVLLLGAVMFSSVGVTAQEIDSTKDPEDAVLEGELGRINAEIETLRESLRELRGRQDTLEGRIDAIATEVRRTELSIARSEVAIASIDEEGIKIEEKILVLNGQVGEQQISIGEILRIVATQDDLPLIAIFLSGGSLSEIANAVEESDKIQTQLLAGVDALRATQESLIFEQELLLERQQEEEKARSLLVIAREDLLVKQEVERQLKDETDEVTIETKSALSFSRLDAAKIRRQLFPLADQTQEGGLTFEEAYIIADPLARSVGIRTPFLLAILQKETRFGKLKGSGNWRTDMHPRDWDAFFTITDELGLDPDTVSVSRAPSYGWGGAMGPAQFLPATWLSYRDRIAEVTGNNPPSPWNITDAFAASAIKLAAGGATAQNEGAEWKAAMLYFAGGNWSNPAYAFYGDSVEDLTSEFAAMISVLEEAGIEEPNADAKTNITIVETAL